MEIETSQKRQGQVGLWHVSVPKVVCELEKDRTDYPKTRVLFIFFINTTIDPDPMAFQCACSFEIQVKKNCLKIYSRQFYNIQKDFYSNIIP
jgi:hypothetical protein